MHTYTSIPPARHVLAEAPESLYRTTTNKVVRRCLQSIVIVRHRSRIAALVRRTIPWSQHHEVARQVAAIGVLVALEKWEPAHAGADSEAFWLFASRYVHAELRLWIDRGTFFRPVAR
jgi:hypothetical protein